MEDKEKTQSNRVFLILAVILLLLSGILGWQLYEQKKANDQLAAEKAQLVVEKDELTSELDELLGKYATMEDENGQLSAELEEQRQLIEQLKADVDKYKGDAEKLGWYRSQLRGFKDKYATLEAKYDSLATVHDSLQGQYGNLQGEFTKQTGLNKELTSENMNLANKVAMGSVLTAYKIAFEGVRGKKDKTNTRAKRVEKLRACFTLSENPITEKGSKNLYVRIVGPDGKVLTKGRGEEFEFEGSSMTYSTSQEVNYDGSAQDLCIFYPAPPENFQEGKHTIEMYMDKALIGTSSVTFR
jgi:myosin heavy subunit